jgi:hypothetical protein
MERPVVWAGRDADLGSLHTSLGQQRVEEFCAMIEGPSVVSNQWLLQDVGQAVNNGLQYLDGLAGEGVNQEEGCGKRNQWHNRNLMPRATEAKWARYGISTLAVGRSR